jgi:hypothetical protein
VASTPLAGGCLCGSVRFEVTEPLTVAGYCHCTRCQRRTGTGASISALVPAGALRVLSGEEQIRCWQPPDGSAKCFCSACGAHLWARIAAEGPHYVRFGAFDDDPGVRPSYRQFVASAPPWDSIPDDGIERFPAARPADA